MAKAIRRITLEKRERINALAGILYHLLPLNSRAKSAITFTSIFNESHISKYLEGPDNKLQSLQQGFTKLYRYHKTLPKIIIRKILPAAIEYRAYIRKPLRQKEIDALAACLEDLGIGMTEEFQKLVIDERVPKIEIPPEKLKESLRLHNLHSDIIGDPLCLFDDGHFNEAVRKAFEKFEARVKTLCHIESSGRDLMARAFSNDEHLNISGIQPPNRADFIDGYKLLTMGSMASIRNIFSHADEERRTPEECFEMLMFANWLFRYIDEESSPKG